MITVTIKTNTLNIAQLQSKLSDMSPLMRQWRDAREDIFENQYEEELNPQDAPLRELSQRYLGWKRRYYPGRKKRELTGKTRESHRFSLGSNTLLEEISGNAIYLEGYLELPIFPETWTNPTERELVSLSEQYLFNL